jgi:hypothetical protein
MSEEEEDMDDEEGEEEDDEDDDGEEDGEGAAGGVADNEWLVHEICMLPPGRFLQISLEDSGARAAEGGHAAAAAGPQPAADDATAAYWANITRTLLAGDPSPLIVLVSEVRAWFVFV